MRTILKLKICTRFVNNIYSYYKYGQFDVCKHYSQYYLCYKYGKYFNIYCATEFPRLFTITKLFYKLINIFSTKKKTLTSVLQGSHQAGLRFMHRNYKIECNQLAELEFCYFIQFDLVQLFKIRQVFLLLLLCVTKDRKISQSIITAHFPPTLSVTFTITKQRPSNA